MQSATLEEERREVWTSILENLGAAPADPDRAAVCRRLLDHLVDCGRRYRFTGTDSSKMLCGS